MVNGAGRLANVDVLDLAAGKVQSERRRIALDSCLRSTSNPAVYVCGDAVAETAELSPIATYEGRIVGGNVVDDAKHTPDYASIPACVFTVPVLASLGLTQADAEEKGLEVRVAANDTSETKRKSSALSEYSDLRHLAFSPGGKYLATLQKGGNLLVWLLRYEDLSAEACSRLTRNMTRNEWREYFGDQAYHPTCPQLPSRKLRNPGPKSSSSAAWNPPNGPSRNRSA